MKFGLSMGVALIESILYEQNGVLLSADEFEIQLSFRSLE